jgi:hypothetical protein
VPIRGEDIGTAYVRILADGDGLDESIREQFDDAEPSVRQAGERNADAYSAAFDKQYRKSFKGNFGKTQKDLFEDLNKGLVQQMARLKLADNFFRSPEWKKFRSRLTQEAGDAGNLAGQRLEQRFRDSADLTGLADAIKKLGPETRRAQADLLREMESMEKESLAERDRNLRNFFKGQQQAYQIMVDNQVKARLDADKEFELSHRRGVEAARQAQEEQQRIQMIGLAQTRAMEEDRRRTLKALISDYEDLHHQYTLVARGSREATVSHSELSDEFRELRRRTVDAGIDLKDVSHTFDEMDHRVRMLTPGLTRLDDRLRTFSDTTGRVFGRGSRNDFLNFFGSTVRNVLTLTRLLPTLATGFFRVGRTFSDAFSGGGGGLSGLQAGFMSLGPLAMAAAGGLAAFAIGAAAVAAIIGPLVALMSGLLAIITALAGSLTFALAGGLVAVAGLIGPAVVGFAALAGAIAAVGPDKLAKRFEPLTDRLKELGDIAGEEIFGNMGPQIDQLQRALRGADTVVRRVSRGVRGAFDGWADDLDSPGFRRWMDDIGDRMPRMIRSLGDIASNTLGGIGGFFSAAAPFVQRFLNWLEDITQQFQDWANSAGGRKEIREFLRDAADSAKAVGGFLEEAVGLLGDLFSAGRGAGDTLFDDMADAMGRFRDYLKENPDALKNWFEDAVELARAIGNAVVSIGQFLDKLDSPEARRNMRALIDGFTWLATTAGNLLDSGLLFPLNRIVELLGKIKMPDLDIGIKGPNLGGMVAGFSNLGPRILKAIGKVNVGNIITGIPRALVSLIAPFNPGASRILRAIGKVNVSNIITGASPALAKLVATFVGGGAKVRRAIGNANVSDVITGAAKALTSLITTFNPASGRILKAIGDVNVSGIISGAATAANNLVEAFRGLAGRIVDAIGTIIPRVNMPNIPGIPGIATGGWFGDVTGGPMLRWVGEDGPEAIVPLDRPLSQVDPAVRALSAIAQGLAIPSVTSAGSGRTIDASGWTVVTPTTDSRAVAVEVVNQLVAVGY